MCSMSLTHVGHLLVSGDVFRCPASLQIDEVEIESPLEDFHLYYSSCQYGMAPLFTHEAGGSSASF
jgi:hypothetical protein